jgi:chromosome segregation ATPase
MSSYSTQSNIRVTENDLRREFKSLLDAKTREYAHEFAANERAIATLERDFRASDRDKNERIKGLEDSLKRGVGGHSRRIDEIESKVRKMEREVRKKENEVEDLMRMNSDKESRIRELEKSRQRY